MEALVNTALSPDFWTGKRILLTGHTGFKGAWCAEVLLRLGAKVTGLALAPEDDSLFVLVNAWEFINDVTAYSSRWRPTDVS